jgi:putative peptidoglycan lipid II flippase
MEKIFRIFGKEYASVNQAAILLGCFAFLTQILGLFRDRFLAHFIGPSVWLDAYYAAFRVPDLIFISIASLISVTVIIPFVLDRMPEGKVTPQAKKFLNDVFTIFFVVIVLVSLIVLILMPEIARLIVPGFSEGMREKVVELSRIMLLSPILLGLSHLFGSITQLFRKFIFYSLSPLFYNLGIITGILFLYPVWGIYGLAFGVVLGALLHFLIQAITSSRCGFSPAFSKKVDWKDIKRVLLVSLPRTLGLSFNSISLILIVAFASFLKGGSISIFNLSLNLQSVPLGIIGLSFSVAAFPALTKAFSSGQIGEFKTQLKNTARQIVFLSLPITFLFIVLRAQIVRVILGSGSFTWENTRLVAASLALFSISIVAQGLVHLFSRTYYASGNTNRPLLVNFVSSLSIVFCSMLFLFLFNNFPLFQYFIESTLKVSDIAGTAILMLPLAYSFGTIVNLTLLWIFIKKDFMPGENFIFKTFFQSLCSSFFLGLVSYLALNSFATVFDINTFWGVLMQGLCAGILGIIAWVCSLYLLKNQEIKDIVKTLHTKFWRAKIVTSQEGL